MLVVASLQAAVKCSAGKSRPGVRDVACAGYNRRPVRGTLYACARLARAAHIFVRVIALMYTIGGDIMLTPIIVLGHATGCMVFAQLKM
jgi:hypothetical protein